MTRGMLSNVRLTDGTVKKLCILCSFSFEERKYLITSDKSGFLNCFELGWGLWNGAYIESEQVSLRVKTVSRFLIKKSDEEKEFYLFRGEHYEVSAENGNYNIKKTGTLMSLRKSARLIPECSRLVAAVLVALAYGFFCVQTSNLDIAVNVFAGLPRNSVIFFFFLIQGAGAAMLFIAKRADRDLCDIFFNALIPFNTVALFGAVKSSAGVRIAVFCVCAASLLILILPKAIRALIAKKKKQRIRNWKTVLHRSYVSFIVCVCISYIAINFMGVSVSTNQSDRTSDTAWFDSSFTEVQEGLLYEKWAGYGNQEKVDILQAVCDHECAEYLGCKPPAVTAGYISDDSVCGFYNDFSKTITINLDYLESGKEEDVLRTLLHEVRHSYQHAAVNALNLIEKDLDSDAKELSCFKALFAFRDDFDNYINGSSDYISYIEQEIERDSRSYAEWRLNAEYKYWIYPLNSESDASDK